LNWETQGMNEALVLALKTIQSSQYRD